ncbi:MAG: right-handed parallel beta-helix repeat-containing protein [Fuerstiella sp.]|nr:hypothetical protein [Fuerstiella sp.]
MFLRITRFPFLASQGAMYMALTSMSGCWSDSNSTSPAAESLAADVIHVHQGEDIQMALDKAAETGCRKVILHEGTYRPSRHGQALIHLNRRHDQIHIAGDGEVILRGDNETIADANASTFPAVVNHVVYFGDGITNSTVMEGVRITGANAFQTEENTDLIQPKTGLAQLTRDQFFFSDGGGIKIFGRSYPTLIDLVVDHNMARPCGGGVSVEHRGFRDHSVMFRNCVFRNNSCQLTGAGVDVLPGSAATFQNCLFVGNKGNCGEDDVSPEGRDYNSRHGSGALTVFPESRVSLDRCTFTGNRNGVDDKGRGNTYSHCLFWQNTVSGGTPTGTRYEMDIIHAVNVEHCHIGGTEPDLRGSLDPASNELAMADPLFDSEYVPQRAGLDGVGYRPQTTK